MATFKNLVSKTLTEERVDWYRGELVLYHGTVKVKAERIRSQGFQAIGSDLKQSVKSLIVPYVERAFDLALERNPQLELLGGFSPLNPEAVAEKLEPSLLDYIVGVRHSVSKVDPETDRGVYCSPVEEDAADYAMRLGNYGSELHKEIGLIVGQWVTNFVKSKLPDFKAVYSTSLGRYSGDDGIPYMVKFHAPEEQLAAPASGVFGSDVLRKLDRGERVFEIIVVGDVPASSIISIYEV